MRYVRLTVSMAAAMTAMACATTADEEPIDGINEPTVTGITLTGAVSEIVTSSAARAYPNIQFNVTVTISNNTSTATEVTYRSACPVRLQLHSLSSPTEKVYDESARMCDAGLSTLSVGPGSSETVFSGVRFPRTVLGDSISPGRYRVTAIFQRENSPLQVDAGTYNIPLCTNEIGCRPVAAGGGAQN
jgi:hypothetical protein